MKKVILLLIALVVISLPKLSFALESGTTSLYGTFKILGREYLVYCDYESNYKIFTNKKYIVYFKPDLSIVLKIDDIEFCFEEGKSLGEGYAHGKAIEDKVYLYKIKRVEKKIQVKNKYVTWTSFFLYLYHRKSGIEMIQKTSRTPDGPLTTIELNDF